MSRRERDGVRDAAASVRCSFCGKRRDQVEAVIAGPTWDIAICNECVDLCAEILAEQRAESPPPSA